MDERSRILIIDDEKIIRDSCTDILAGHDYRLLTVQDGAKGLDLVSEFQPDLVYVDLKMPGMPGMEVIERINAMDPTVVTIVITGFGTINSAVEAMKKGAYDFLPKPFTPEEFRIITRRGLERRKLVLETIALRQEKEMLRENFAAIVSHELKAPLGAVQQNLFALSAELSGKLDVDQKRRMDRMKSRIADLVQLINTWLRAISVDLETIKDQFEPVSIPFVVSNAIESVQPHAIRKNIEILTSLDEPLSMVLGDKGTLTEVLINICNNAVKYSQPNRRITIKAKEKDTRILIQVVDQGLGISKDDLPFVFNDFYRGKSGLIGESGCGMGLAISKRIIEIHNGTLTVESEVGRGSTFIITLPAYGNYKQIMPTFRNNVATSL